MPYTDWSKYRHLLSVDKVTAACSEVQSLLFKNLTETTFRKLD